MKILNINLPTFSRKSSYGEKKSKEEVAQEISQEVARNVLELLGYSVKIDTPVFGKLQINIKEPSIYVYWIHTKRLDHNTFSKESEVASYIKGISEGCSSLEYIIFNKEADFHAYKKEHNL